jgi:hypothetical protein
LYDAGDLPALVKQLSSPAAARETLSLGQGVWEVFSAPHIVNLSNLSSTRFSPIRYSLEGEHIYSNVKFIGPLGIEGWLSAAGSIKIVDDTRVEVMFEDFWVDMGGDLRLRPDITRGTNTTSNTSTTSSSSSSSNTTPMDSLVNTMGRAGFFPGLATFPVAFLDEDVCVFEFVPLKSTVACVKVGAAGSGTINPAWTIASFDSDM